jgi:hypothetical protein
VIVVRCCGLSKGWNGGDGEVCLLMWFIMLKSAEDRIIGVDTLVQLVLPRVHYGMACLLIIIRDAMGSVSCLFEWGLAW